MDGKSSKYLGKDINKSSDESVTSQLWKFPNFGLRDMIKAQEQEKERDGLREIIKDREGEYANSNARDSRIGIQPVSSNDAGKGWNDGKDSKGKKPLLEKSFRDVIVSATSNERSKAGRNTIEKTIEEERQSDAQRSQEHEMKSASSVIRSRIHEISINKINEENVRDYLNKLYEISNKIANFDANSVNSIEQKKKHTRFLRESHMQLKIFMIESHDLYQRCEQSKRNKTQIKNEQEFDCFVKQLVKTEKDILYKYDLDYSPEEKSEYDKANSAVTDENTWREMYSKFKGDIEKGTPEIKKEKLKDLILNYKSTINRIRAYRKLDRSSPKEAAFQRLEYGYLKSKMKAFNLIWKDLQEIKNIKDYIPCKFLPTYERLEKGTSKLKNPSKSKKL